jgi:hypothetical protein
MRYELNSDGTISKDNHSLKYDVEEILRKLFTQNFWEIVQLDKDGVKWTLHIINMKISPQISYKFNLFVGKIRNESRNPKEKKIQLNGKDPRVLGNIPNLILGIYAKDEHTDFKDMIFVGWSVDNATNYTSNPSIRGVNVDILQNAFLNGFVRYEYKSKVTCMFKPDFIFYYLENYLLLHQLPEVLESTTLYNHIQSPQNQIYFGAPGTGKSHKIETEILNGVPREQQERITFHPDYDNASFVGSYMPESDADGNITYQFVAQVFTNIYIKAWQNIDKPYFLVIEEINRGNCAEIFGDIFQLLDRTSNYAITPKSALQKYLIKELKEKGLEGIKNGKIILPPNLQLLATMNTSDQSLFPMDSAFKRRWTWKYVPINYDRNEANLSASFAVRLDENHTFSWLDFIEKVNLNYIKNNENLGEDKCIGNYFIKPNDTEISLEEFINKVIFYLWNDVFKDEEETPFENGKAYSDFFPESTKGKDLVEAMLTKLEIETNDSSETSE